MARKQSTPKGEGPKRERRASPKKARKPAAASAPDEVDEDAADAEVKVEVGFSADAGTRGVAVREVVTDPPPARKGLCDRVLDDLLAHGPTDLAGIVGRTGIFESAVEGCLGGLIEERKVGPPVNEVYDASRCYRVLVDLDLHGPSTPGDIARRTPITEAAVRTCLENWAEEGEVESRGKDLFARKPA